MEQQTQTPKTQCPPVRDLSALIDGKMVEPELSSHASHLETCELCQNTIRTLFPSDTLVESLRGNAPQADLIAQCVPRPLIEALKQIPAVDSIASLSADGLNPRSGMSLDELGLSFLDPAVAANEIGRLGHYRIQQVLGRGGMGVVFLAEDPRLGRRVALKVMLPRIASIQAARDRFLREAKAAASLKNDHIVTIYQVDEINGVPFLAMELLQGKSLEDALRSGRRFSIAETIHIARDIARGLADAHEKALVHRDIKPGNLWLEQTPDGAMRVKILDFGLARAEVDDVHITEFGTIVGTPAFMAPEQARADRAVDGRADLFSLGCVLYVLSTGEIPFKADTTVGTLMALALNTPVAPSQRNDAVPAELSRLTMQLLEKDPAQRPASARDVIERLRQVERLATSATTDTGTFGQTLLGISKPIAALPAAVARTARKSVSRGVKIVAGLLFAASLLYAAQVILWKTQDGRVVRIECNDPEIMLAFEGGELKVTGAYDQPIRLAPGNVDLKITKPQPDGEAFEFETDKLVVRKGDQIALKIEVLDGEMRIVQDGMGVLDSKPLVSATEQFARLVAALKAANPGFDGAVIPDFQDHFIVGLTVKTDNVSDIGSLSQLKHLQRLQLEGNYSSSSGVTDLSPLTGLPLTELSVDGNTRLSDLKPLQGMSLRKLSAHNSAISDLTPLAGMPLEELSLWAWDGSDLSPLKGLPLIQLNIGGSGQAMDLKPLTGAPLQDLVLNMTKVSDISPLKGMPLTVLTCENTLVSDLSPLNDARLQTFIAGGSQITDFSILRDMPLTWVKWDMELKRDLALLREIKTLVRINDQRAVDFFREVSEDPVPRPVPPTFTNSIGMEFVLVPKGKAWLARKVAETETTPSHETVFEDDFYLGMFEVTQEEWVKVMGSNPSWFTRNADGAADVKILPDELLKRLPVERVNWLDCQQFLQKLNELDSTPGWVYRLPTEAEWQYACRGGPMRDPSEAGFEFFTPEPADQLTAGNAISPHEFALNRPCRVGLFPPNKLGLYDMHGNVWEWCHDAASWRAEPSRFIHGGGWREPASESRASNIKQPTEPWMYYDLGLRVARVLAE
jgi:serine/threonine protein kinase/formylglycine-generating enzyme required for sulfatase activity